MNFKVIKTKKKDREREINKVVTRMDISES